MLPHFMDWAVYLAHSPRCGDVQPIVPGGTYNLSPVLSGCEWDLLIVGYTWLTKGIYGSYG